MADELLGSMGAEIAQHKETIRKMNRYCAELEEHFREIGRIATGCEEGKGPAAITAICQKALGDTGVRCFWPEEQDQKCSLVFRSAVTGEWHSSLRKAGTVSAVRCETCDKELHRHADERDSDWNVSVSKWEGYHSSANA